MRRTTARHVRALGVAAVVFAFGLLAHPASAGDSIELRDGTRIEGDIREFGATHLRIETASGERLVARADVRAVRRGDRADDAHASTLPDLTSALGPKTRSAAGESASSSRGPKARTAAQRRVDREAMEAAAAAEHPDPAVVAALEAVTALESPDAAVQVAMMDEIREAWPESRPLVEAVLRVASDPARTSAVRLLRSPRLGKSERLLQTALVDSSPVVRMQALRAVRDRRLSALEGDVTRLLSGNDQWRVRQEALRALERIAGPQSLRTVLALWSIETEPDRRRRLKRVLVAIVGEDLGEESEPWWNAVSEAHVGHRSLRDAADRRRAAAKFVSEIARRSVEAESGEESDQENAGTGGVRPAEIDPSSGTADAGSDS